MKRKITKIVFNWFFTTKYGEDYSSLTIGSGGVVSIKEDFGADGRFCNVLYESGAILQVRNINSILYEPEEDGE